MASSGHHVPLGLSSGTRSSLVNVPAEIMAMIASYLSNRDIKNMRLTCSFVRDTAPLRLARAFLSANPLNVQVFRAIADHEMLRKQIVEIIWDDARLGILSKNSNTWEGNYDEEDDLYDADVEAAALQQGCPRWYVDACKENESELKSRQKLDQKRPDNAARVSLLASQLPGAESWRYYQKLLREQNEILSSGADADALQYGLERFPSLKKITITPAAHGWLFNPLYATPMIRAFPNGFNYPLPRGWPTGQEWEPSPYAFEWHDAAEAEKNNWRGFRIVVETLAQYTQHRVSELVLQVNGLRTGLHCHMFDKPCKESNNLITLFQRSEFRRLDLALNVGGQEHQNWHSFRNGYLRRVLAEATMLEHFTFCTDVVTDPDASASDQGSAGSADHFIPLQSIFPIDKWERLRHFGLRLFLVQEDDVIPLLAALPTTVQSVELSFLLFLDNGGSYLGLLYKMRDRLGWRERPVHMRPQVSISVPCFPPLAGRAVWIDREVNKFLYGDGVNPFQSGEETLSNWVPYGRGVVQDAFDPDFEQPWLDYVGLMQLGYYEKSPWVIPE